MVNIKEKIYLIENDHRLEEFCKEKGYSPNNIPLADFIDIAEEIGWVMSAKDFEMHHNTRTLPKHYYIRIPNENVTPEGTI
jgi:hypothetical protein